MASVLGCPEEHLSRAGPWCMSDLLTPLQAPLRAFHEQTAWYTQLTEALPPLLHPSSGSLSDPEILHDILWLGSALVTHPAYPRSG